MSQPNPQLSPLPPVVVNAELAGRMQHVIEDAQAFGELNFTQVRVLTKYLRIGRAEKGSAIFMEGDHGDFAAVVLEGRVDLYKENARRQRRLLQALGSGKIFGEIALIDEETRSATALAAADTLLILLTRKEFLRLAEEKPGLAFKLLTKFSRVLSQRLRQTSGMMMECLND